MVHCVIVAQARRQAALLALEVAQLVMEAVLVEELQGSTDQEAIQAVAAEVAGTEAAAAVTEMILIVRVAAAVQAGHSASRASMLGSQETHRTHLNLNLGAVST